MLGLDFGLMNFGTETREEPLSSTIPDLRVKVENSYDFLSGDILFRLISPNTDALVRPYVDACSDLTTCLLKLYYGNGGAPAPIAIYCGIPILRMHL